MAKQPFFTSAPRITLLIGSSRVGYAIGLTLNISISVEPVKILGTFETLSLEPLAYLPVTGSMRILKLLPISQQTAVLAGAKEGSGTAPRTFSINNDSTSTGMEKQGAIYQHVNPASILISKSFDLNIDVRGLTATAQAAILASKNAFVTQANSNANFVPAATETPAEKAIRLKANEQFLLNGPDLFNSPTYSTTNFMKIIDCRITSMDTDLSPSRLMEEAVSWQGLLAISQAQVNSTTNHQQLDFLHGI